MPLTHSPSVDDPLLYSTLHILHINLVSERVFAPAPMMCGKRCVMLSLLVIGFFANTADVCEEVKVLSRGCLPAPGLQV